MELFKPRRASASPAELLAFDEALLDHAESTDHPGFLTFWESTTYFVVLGYSKTAERELFEEECARLSIPILRRCSGGGTVLQGPGCLNYGVVLPIDSAAELESITGANKYIMAKTRAALASLISGKVEIRGHTDLTVDGRKFSGNAQRRKRRCLLFHGSFILRFDLALISTVLRLPEQQPDYRKNREHESFLMNLQIDAKEVERVLIGAWNARPISDAKTEEQIKSAAKHLVLSKYSRTDWNLRS